MQFQVEEISAVDVELLREPALALHRHEIAVQPELGGIAARCDEEYWAHYRDRFAGWMTDGNGFTFVARAGDEILGFVFCVEREGLAAYESGERIGYVEEIGVVESARGAGVGRALMEAARERFSQRGYKWFELSTVPGNDAARGFYQSLGLEPAAVMMIGRA